MVRIQVRGREKGMKDRLHGCKGVWVYLGLGNRLRGLLTGVRWDNFCDNVYTPND